MLIFVAFSAVFAAAQSGGSYEITQSVIASGGGQNSENGNFLLDGTVGQPLAGTQSTGGSFNLRGGFWAEPTFAPTAATVSLSGRITLDRPGFMQNVSLTLQNLSTGVIHSTNPRLYGYYRFDELEIGTYLITAEGGDFQFTPPSIVITLLDNIEDANFTGQKLISQQIQNDK